MKAVLLINREAQRMRSEADHLVEIARAQKQHDLTCRLLQASELVKQLENSELNIFERVIVAGGDGTVAAAADRLATSDTELGIIPGGTVNSFARSLEIPEELGEALDIALQSKAQKINLGKANGQYFTNAVSVGLSGEVAESVPDELKAAIGSIGYLSWGLYKFVTTNAFEVKITVDGETIETETYQVVVANSQLVGSLPVKHGSDVAKDHLVVMTFGQSSSRVEHIKNLVAFARGNHDEAPGVSVSRGKKITIETKDPQKVDIDGEVVGNTPVVATISTGALSVAF